MFLVPAIEILPWEKLARLRYFRSTIVERLCKTKDNNIGKWPSHVIVYHSKPNDSFHCLKSTLRSWMTTILISCALGELFLYLCSWNVTEFPHEIGMLSGLVEAVRVLFSYLDRKLRRGPSNQVIAKSVELSVSFCQACEVRIFQCWVIPSF